MTRFAFVVYAVMMAVPLLVGTDFTGRAKAQEGGADKQPTVQDILQQITKNDHFSIRAAQSDIDLANARRDAARAALYPRLTLSASGQFFRPSPEIYQDERRDIYGNLEVVQPLYDFGKTASAIEAANRNGEAASILMTSARNAVLMEGMALFFDLHASELEMRALSEGHASAYVRWERSKERLELGQSDPVKVAEKLTRVEQTRLDYYRERNRNISLRLQLEELTGNFIEEELFSPPKPPKQGLPEMDRHGFAEKVAANNPQLLALTKQAQAKGLLRGGVGNLPKVEAFGNVGKTSREVRSRNDYAIGARLTWPIFDGGINRSQRSQLAAEESRINAAISRKRSQLRIAAHNAILELQNSYQQVVASRAKLDYAGRSLLKRQQLYSQERVADLGRAMIDNTAAEAGVVRATGIYFLDLAKIAVLLGQNPGKALEADFLASIAQQSGNIDQYVPKTGSGFGQEDQNITNRKLK